MTRWKARVAAEPFGSILAANSAAQAQPARRFLRNTRARLSIDGLCMRDIMNTLHSKLDGLSMTVTGGPWRVVHVSLRSVVTRVALKRIGCTRSFGAQTLFERDANGPASGVGAEWTRDAGETGIEGGAGRDVLWGGGGGDGDGDKDYYCFFYYYYYFYYYNENGVGSSGGGGGGASGGFGGGDDS